MAESAGKQLLLSALTEGHEKHRSKASKTNKTASKTTATGSEKGAGDRSRGKRQKGVVSSGGQTTVTSTSSSSKCKCKDKKKYAVYD